MLLWYTCSKVNAALFTGFTHSIKEGYQVALEYAESLNQWFLQYQRKMPWRLTHDPYCIWVSEIMLQQTQVETVIPYYERFMERFPTLQALAEADLEEVFYFWKGLGYYRRAENIHKGARMIVDELGGCFPETRESLAEIPGIGPYTIGAISSIAYNLPVPAVDGNVMRILSRQFALSEDISKPKARKTFEALVLQLMKGEPRIFNQAMMELGALICLPKSPKCEICPQKYLCKAFAQGEAEAYPVKSKKPRPLEEEYAALIIQKDNSYLLEKRPAHGLLANLWGLPIIEASALSGELGEFEALEPVSHVFTHRKWLLRPFKIRYSAHTEALLGKYSKSCNHQFFTLESLKELPIATAFQKVIDQLSYDIDKT